MNWAFANPLLIQLQVYLNNQTTYNLFLKYYICLHRKSLYHMRQTKQHQTIGMICSTHPFIFKDSFLATMQVKSLPRAANGGVSELQFATLNSAIAMLLVKKERQN